MYRLSNLAAEDFAAIFEYSLLTFGLEQADSYLGSLEDFFQLLIDNPYIGVDRGYLHPDMRMHTFQSHNIFYIPKEHEIEIVRILHTSMEVKF